MMTPAWKVDGSMIVTRSEIRTVLADLGRRCKRSANSRCNRAVFRLATCCGLRASEIAGLRLDNLRLGTQRPHIYLPKGIAKGGKKRRVPLWWDVGTLADLTAWKAERTAQGATGKDFVVCAQSKAAAGRPIDRRNIRQRFRVACRTLGPDRLATLTVHHGRHSFVSHALAGGRTLAEVRDAAGHSSVATTSIYIHVAVDDDGTVGDLFAFDTPSAGAA